MRSLTSATISVRLSALFTTIYADNLSQDPLTVDDVTSSWFRLLSFPLSSTFLEDLIRISTKSFPLREHCFSGYTCGVVDVGRMLWWSSLVIGVRASTTPVGPVGGIPLTLGVGDNRCQLAIRNKYVRDNSPARPTEFFLLSANSASR